MLQYPFSRLNNHKPMKEYAVCFFNKAVVWVVWTAGVPISCFPALVNSGKAKRRNLLSHWIIHYGWTSNSGIAHPWLQQSHRTVRASVSHSQQYQRQSWYCCSFYSFSLSPCELWVSDRPSGSQGQVPTVGLSTCVSRHGAAFGQVDTPPVPSLCVHQPCKLLPNFQTGPEK